MVEDWVIKTMYATKRRRRTVKSVKAPVKDPPKSNPSKRHRERLNSELDHLASLLPFEQSVISKLDKLSVLRLAVSYLRTKSYFQAVLPTRYGIESHLMTRAHLFHEPNFSEGDSILQALYGFLFVVTCEGEVFFASRTVEQYLGFHQSDIIHQSVMELIHSEDREEFKRQLTWSSMLPQDKASVSLHEIMLPDNIQHLHRSFTVRFRCLLDNTSGFITLELNGWIRVLHGQSPRSEEPQLALFATCSPFGPLSLFDIPSRELTFKSKHKMDFSPLTMDNRGKMMFGFTDQEMSVRSGYDLIHPDDLVYFSAAHQELIKTGSSGLIAYRWMTKNYRWMWLQSSCKVIYKNSKPDFIICTHRQLTDDEGQDLFTKRGNEFKLPYPLLDLDMCSGFGFGDEELGTKSKSTKSKKKGSQAKECSQNGKKRKGGTTPSPASCPFNGISGYAPTYPPLNVYDTAAAAEFKPADLYYSNGYGFESDLYRSHGYAPFPPPVYPPVDPYGRLDTSEKHCFSNGYLIDHRQYQPPLAYTGNTYSDVVASSAKYGYDVPKYGFDSYSLDLSKRMGGAEEVPHPPPPPPPPSGPPQMDGDLRGKFGHEFHQQHDRYNPRLNGTGLEPVDLRSSSMFVSNSFMNTVEGAVAPSCVSSLFKPIPPAPASNLLPKDPKMDKTGSVGLPPMTSSSGPLGGLSSTDLIPVMSLGHSSVIKSTSGLHQDIGLSGMPNTSLSLVSASQTPPHHHQSKNCDPGGVSSWSGVCVGVGVNQSGGGASVSVGTPNPVNSPGHHELRDELGQGTSMNGSQGTACHQHQAPQQQHPNHGCSSPKSGGIPASVIQSRVCDKQSGLGGIPVPVVKSSANWFQHFNNNNNHNTNNNNNTNHHLPHIQMNGGDRDWGPPQDYFSKPFRSHLIDGYQHVKVDVL